MRIVGAMVHPVKLLDRALTVALACTSLLLFDSISDRLHATYFNVPSGHIFYSKNGSCPSGWSEYTTARGRYIVGLVAAGTNAATVGTALSNSESRAVGTHTHVQDAHNHIADAHNHIQDAHGHTQNAHNHTQNAHSHTFSFGGNDPNDYNVIGSSTADAIHPTGTRPIDNATSTNQNATATNQNATATNQNTTGTNQAATATNQNAGSVAGTNAPYVQLIACQKS